MNAACRHSLAMAATMVLTGILSAPTNATAQDGGVSEEAMKAGETLFLTNCRQCHGTKGTAGTPLKGNEKLENADFLITTILTGPGYMTDFADHLDDEQIALIATYVRNRWENAYGPVAPEAVTPLR